MEADSPIQHGDDTLEGAGDLRLFRRWWVPESESPRAAVLLVHGYGEHSGRYDHLGRWLGARNLAVHAYDHRGHGRSGGRTCHVDAFDDYLDDVGRMLDHVRREHAGLPLFLVGHSMGGLIVSAFLRERHPDIEGAVTSGAALAVPDTFSPFRVWAARLLRGVAPRLSLPSGLDAAGISRDPEVVRVYQEDPLVHSTMTSSLAVELLRALQRTAGGGAAVRVPMLLLHGESDPLCHVDGSREFHATLTTPGSDLCVYPGLYHEIFNEPEQEAVFQDLLAWVEGRLARAS